MFPLAHSSMSRDELDEAAVAEDQVPGLDVVAGQGEGGCAAAAEREWSARREERS